MKLSTQDRQFILDSIKRLPLYFEVSVNHVNYVMVHGGLGDYFFDASKKLSRYKRDDFIWSRLEPSKKYYSNKSIIVGHTPTPNLTVRHTSEIVCSNGNYWIDCGCVFGYKLACLCLNTLEEFYVDKLK
jgi:serine/threonine protein phosphatase 1